MDDPEGINRAEEIAKRAAELAARAEELARQAHEVSGIDDQLARLDQELAALDAEERALDGELGTTGERRAGQQRVLDWTDALSARLDGLGDLINDAVTNAMTATPGTESVLDWQQAVSAATSIRVSNGAGSINVTRGQAGVVRVRARSRNRKRGHDGLRPGVTCELRDGSVHVETTRGSWRPQVTWIDVEVPEGSPLDLGLGGGAIDVTDVHGPVAARTGGGRIAILGGAGSIQAKSGGGSISITEIDGDVVAMTGGGSVRVGGRLHGDSSVVSGGGSIKIGVDEGTNVAVTARGQAAATDLPGLAVNRGRITGNLGDGTGGTLRVRTAGGQIRINRS